MTSIAILVFSKTVGGLELAALRRAEELRNHGHRVVTILPDSPRLVRQATMQSLPVEVITPAFDYADPLAAFRVRRVLRRYAVDVLVVARARDLSTALLAAESRTAVVLYNQMQSGLSQRDPFHDAIYRRVDGCVTITCRNRDELIRCTALAPEKIAVIPYGVDLIRFRRDASLARGARSQHGVPPDAFVVGIVGAFNKAKGQKEFIEALGIAARLDRELGQRLFGLLVGESREEDDTFAKELHALRDALPFPERIQFHPFTDDPSPAYRAMDLFVLASHSETFGMVLQEAMAMGVPSIGTNSGGVPEIIEDGVTGLLVPPRNSSAIADAIVRLYRDPELRGRIAGKALSFVREAYDLERQYQKFERALVDALTRRRKQSA